MKDDERIHFLFIATGQEEVDGTGARDKALKNVTVLDIVPASQDVSSQCLPHLDGLLGLRMRAGVPSRIDSAMSWPRESRSSRRDPGPNCPCRRGRRIAGGCATILGTGRGHLGSPFGPRPSGPHGSCRAQDRGSKVRPVEILMDYDSLVESLMSIKELNVAAKQFSGRRLDPVPRDVS